MATQMQSHLRKYVEDGIQQKVRLNNLRLDYLDQENKTRERAIDQRVLFEKYQAENRPQEIIDDVIQRQKMDEEILYRIKRMVSDTDQIIDGTTNRMVSHLEELTTIEFETGGFIAHVVGVDKNVLFDEETKAITFESDGHVEIPVAPRIGNWKDSSQLTIKRINKAGA